ncbi:xanthine dehydrogenase family protein molybdopterin-binding subunit [Sandarakinorhabdus sp. AAP62]|uniref:xanthine dehydrogenase family protein molybdopterin-binding subunit n=1 Tax=Sandarakinorhabdus sp. AAP62 TaxID=1248916 RepID=UPI0002FB7F5D|nr:xanthine dehydrogenase family protein molybdopterin-binding subunit [Sandarakinorhabdus sp. AAP62]
MGAKFGIGQAVRRAEDRRFVAGSGRYVGDIVLPGMAHAVVVYSQHAHGMIRSIDTSRASAMPGVIAVLTGADAVADGIGGLPPYFMPADSGGPPGYRTIRPILVADRVRCIGDRIAVVIAESERQARDAAAAIDVDIAPLPAVVSPDAAAAPGAPLVWDDCPGNACFTLAFGDVAATEAAFARAAHVVALTIHNNRISANSIEPRCAVGCFDPATAGFVLHTSSQNPHGVRKVLAQSVLHVPENDIRVISPDVGGGFGMKADAYPEDAIVLWAARRLGRPVKWVGTRSEALMGDNHGRDQTADAALALDEHGRALGLRLTARHALGAYVASATVAPITFAMRMLPGVYDIPAVAVRTTATFTNCSPTGPYRGAGRPEACFALERLMDMAARAIGIDRVDIRRRNLISADQMPYTTAVGVTYDSGDFGAMMDRCLSLADWSGFPERQRQTEAKGWLRGRAVTSYLESAGVFNDRMELRFDPEGNVTILAGTHSHGQGHATVFPQLIHEWLGLPYDKIKYIQGDTDKVAFGRGTYAARSSMLAGTALHAAAQDAIAKGRTMAAQLLDADIDDIMFADGQYSVGQGNRTIGFADVVKAFYRPIGVPGGLSLGLTTIGTAGGQSPNFPNGAHVCEVEVDPATGAIHIDRYVVVDDVGRILNPMICEGQIVGGIAQGLGQALLEAIVYDPDSGQLLSGSFSDYGMPRPDTMPLHIESELAEIPCKTNVLGVKGVGESGTIAAPPTLVNAVLDALWPLGVTDIAMPLTPARVWTAIDQASKRGAA